jgi:hypothetical protein
LTHFPAARPATEVAAADILCDSFYHILWGKILAANNWEPSSAISRETWSKIFSMDNEATPFQSYDWMHSITSKGQFRNVSRQYKTPDGDAILPLAASSRPDVFCVAASMPHGWGAGGLISSTPITVNILQTVFDDLSGAPFLRLTIRPNARQIDLWDQALPESGWSRVARKTHILDLSGGIEVVLRHRFESTKRNRIRKAQQADLTVEKGNSPELIRQFYDLYLLWSENRARSRGLPVSAIRRLAELREPFWRFSSAACGMGPKLQVYLARHQREPVAASVFLMLGRSAVYWRGASDAALRGTYPGNDLLQYEMIKDACEAGCQQYHLGESGGVRSLERFKEHFGAEPYCYAEYVRERLPVTAVEKAAGRLISKTAALFA